MQWYSASRNEYIDSTKMTVSHIKNTLNCLKGLGKSKIPDPFQSLSHKEWIIIFEKELYNRNNKQKIYELW